MSKESEEHELAQAFGCFLWIILIVCCCCSYYLGKHVGRTELMNELICGTVQLTHERDEWKAKYETLENILRTELHVVVDEVNNEYRR